MKARLSTSGRLVIWADRTLDTVTLALMVGVIAAVCSPMFQDLTTYGGHDWDVSEAFRYLVVKSIKTYHQFPFWNPYVGGGYTSWGYVESSTIVVSPFLPLYLLLELRTAVRIEVVLCALFSLAGTWLLAGRFTRSAPARALACTVFVVNGRWALQAAMGHSWHLYFAWMPWALYALDRAPGFALHEPGRYRWACIAGGFIALMIYSGAHYPLVYSLCLIGLYALALTLYSRSVMPLLSASLSGLVGFGLAAPKLLAVLDVVSKSPRLIESNEYMDLGVFLHTLIAPSQQAESGYVRVSQWGWHEWGSYIGWGSLLFLAIGVACARDVRLRLWRWIAFVLLLLAFGNFHEHSPWHYMHKLPIFSSLHVPSRWLYPALLLCGLMAAGTFGRWVRPAGSPRYALELLLLAAVAYCAVDIGRVSNALMQNSFWMRLHPGVREEQRVFRQEMLPPPGIDYMRRDWGIPGLPSVIANVGIVENTTVGPVSVYSRDASGKVPGLGAIPRGYPGYQGEVFLKSGTGKSEYVRWSPNELTVRVQGAKAGDVLIINQNFDPGWRANGRGTHPEGDRIAVALLAAEQSVTFRYVPRTWYPGLAVCLGTIAAMSFAYRLRKKRTFTKSGPASPAPRTETPNERSSETADC
ncbi:MAG TPA: hypothetical protein VK524_29780 [Polyangiaceae bacterium]|nr:hypothetical protein [Polyangiaceae bacterium]